MTATKTPENSTISKDWKPIYRRWWFWVIEVPFVIIFVGALLRIPALNERERTQEVVAQIHAQKLTLADVNGDNLPRPPDPAKVDATLEGIDANTNGIRDDVELAIFKKYPNSVKIRAAELQYAMELQFQFTKVFSTGTFIAAIQEGGRGFGCIFETEPGHYPDFSKALADQNKRVNDRLDEVKNLVLNTDARKSKYDSNYDKYMTSFTTLGGLDCDIDPATLAE